MMSNNEGFMCTDYLLLKPQEATFIDLIKLLWCNDNTHFIETRFDIVDELRRFRYRWLVFISIVMMKLFILLKTPMAYVGYFLEVWLNLVSDYGGLFSLLLNFIKGKVKMPKRTSETYKSMIGCLDTRLDLEPNIHLGHPKYQPALSLMASKISYENSSFIQNVVQNHWKMKLIGCYNFKNDYLGKNSTHAFISRNITQEKDLTVISFRGTSPFDAEDWCTDFSISWYGLTGVGRVHGGFINALGLQITDNLVRKELDPAQEGNTAQFAYYEIKKVIKQICEENKNAKFIITGHSLGGALAILFASVLILHDEKELLDNLDGVYTFGQPRVGDANFGEFMVKKLKTYNVKYCRYVYCNDMVPRLPYDDKTLLFKHFGPCLYFNSFYHGKVLEEEPNKNYNSLIWLIPKYMNAWWELIRGFIYPYIKWGPNYKEGWCLHVFRVIGLILPGLSAHGPQDYDNITRLGHM
ncbi:hypothetical protein RND81_06G110200 [Saponaria officinalis]|uniref:Fungal lipase-type domain-containing protein n=1 Tax=Saponaria officinalis TaxID=3572 RepID=A0AAW1KAD4_SAPOF